MNDLRDSVMNASTAIPRIGAVIAGPGKLPPFLVVDGLRVQVEPAVTYLRDLALGDASPLTGKSYGHDLLRWFRLLWLLGVAWDQRASPPPGSLPYHRPLEWISAVRQ